MPPKKFDRIPEGNITLPVVWDDVQGNYRAQGGDAAGASKTIIKREVSGTATPVIAAGQFETALIWGLGVAAGIILMPPAWTPAVLTFRIKYVSNNNVLPLYDEGGNEVQAQAAASRAVHIPPEVLASGGQGVIIRSGTEAAPVIQVAEARLEIVGRG